MNEGKRLLYEQLRELQNADDEAEDEKIEKIAYRIYCLSPQTEEMDNNVERFKKIWTKLDRSTKKTLNYRFLCLKILSHLIWRCFQ